MPISSILSCEIIKCFCYLASVNWVFCSLTPNASQVISLPQDQVIMGEFLLIWQQNLGPNDHLMPENQYFPYNRSDFCSPLRAQRNKAISYQHHDCHQLSRNLVQNRLHQTHRGRQAGGASSSLPSSPSKAHLVKDAGSKTKVGKLYWDFIYSDARVAQAALWVPEVHLWWPWLHSRLLPWACSPSLEVEEVKFRWV